MSGAVRVVVLAVLVTLGMLGRTLEVDGQTMDQKNYLFLMVNDLEQAPGLGERPILVDAEAWYGGDYNRLWLKLEGDASTLEPEGELEAQALFSRLISPWWDLQAGVRVDRAWGGGGRTRPHLALALQGLAPYWFEVETSVFLDVDGNVSAAFTAAYDMLLTQSLILEPEFEVGLSVQDVPDWGIGAGVHDFVLGGRLRYEIRREFAPYVGFVWHRASGGTADLRRTAGLPVGDGSLVFGVRAWY
ncbi:MAG: copper resistance protein B [Gemmatimonadota bacterium]